MSVSFQFIGCGDAFGSGGRFQTCFLIEDSNGRFCIDFGASSLIGLKSHNIDPASLDMILISHLHGDHFAGLPFLLLDLHLHANSEKILTLVGPPGFAYGLKKLCNAMYHNMWETEWNYSFNVIEIEPGVRTKLVGRTVVTKAVAHSTQDIQATAIRIDCDDKTIAYSGDTGWTEDLIGIAAGTDLFICECNFYNENVSKTHLNYATILKNRERLKTKQLILTHLSDEALRQVENMDIESAEDGKIVFL